MLLGVLTPSVTELTWQSELGSAEVPWEQFGLSFLLAPDGNKNLGVGG